MSDADKALSNLLDDCASDGAEYFDDCGSEESAIIAAFLRSSHGDEAFCDININEHVACILAAASNRDEYERRRVALCAYLTNVARDSAKVYVDRVLPGKRHIYRYYAKQDAQSDWGNPSLTDAITGIVRPFSKAFG